MRIHSCAKQGNIEGVKRELASGVPIDAIDRDEGYTPLMYAVTSPDAGVDMVQLLIREGANIAAEGGILSKTPVLGLAARAGDIQKVKTLVDAGAEVYHDRSGGYDILIDTAYGHAMSNQDRFLELVKLFLEKGASPDVTGSWGESAICIASGDGRFDVVRLLLDAGADSEQLMWSDLMYAVVFGNLSDIKTLVEEGADLADRDCWCRTPWLLSLQVGDIEKAKLLLSLGAKRDEAGHCGRKPLMYAVRNERIDILRWLLEEGFDVEASDDFGDTPLIEACEYGFSDCVKILLDHGAKTEKLNSANDKAISVASSLHIVRMLVSAGADLNDISTEMRRVLTAVGVDKELHITKEQYLAGKHPRFGTANPEVMEIEFWKDTVRSGITAYAVEDTFADTDWMNGPVWCFERFGKSITELPDGRIVEIAGEHEDYYDSDFYIYNDVIVHNGDGTFTIYGYPRDVFPPTDFHSATLVDNHIYIIGSLGYAGERSVGETPAYRLNCDTFEIEKIVATGEDPGWIHRHKARLKNKSEIEVTGGEIYSGEEGYVENQSTYMLNLTDMSWTCLRA